MTRIKPLLFAGLLALAALPAAAKPLDPCASASTGAPCACNLATLHPLQGGIGMAQVDFNINEISKHPGKEREKLLADPIKVVKGPDGGLYITDHHHGALAWLRFQTAHRQETNSICQVAPLPEAASMDQFARTLQTLQLVRLFDANGQKIQFQALPKTLLAMKDDPYRTIAGETRRQGAWCRYPGAVEFAEFQWADYLRPRLQVTPKNVTKPKLIEQAAQLSRDPAAHCVPGYLAPAAGATCPATPPAPDAGCPAS